MPIILINRFLKFESASGIVLFAMAIISMVWANSSYAGLQQVFIEKYLFWINEGLMAIFFLLVGLELKRAFLDGQLSTPAQILMPAVAALGGMLVPAIIYLLFNFHNPVTIRGWATPTATDIAFALGVLSLFGKRIPAGLKLFLLALAIYDDLGAIIIIAFFYSKGLSYIWLTEASLLLIVLFLLNYYNVRLLFLYFALGIALWFCLLHSGIHPTIAGFLLALFIPDGWRIRRRTNSPLHHLEKALNPWVAFIILPLFALANTGFSLSDVSLSNLMEPIVLGIIFGLFLGKQLGVFGFTWCLIRSLNHAKLPDRSTWLMLYGVALICGIGFTMSLFLGTLAFTPDKEFLADVRMGVMIGSLLSGITGALVLWFVSNRRKRRKVLE